jgi:hypothetical protein
VTFRLSTFCLAMESILRLFGDEVEAAMAMRLRGQKTPDR